SCARACSIIPSKIAAGISITLFPPTRLKRQKVKPQGPARTPAAFVEERSLLRRSLCLGTVASAANSVRLNCKGYFHAVPSFIPEIAPSKGIARRDLAAPQRSPCRRSQPSWQLGLLPRQRHPMRFRRECPLRGPVAGRFRKRPPPEPE